MRRYFLLILLAVSINCLAQDHKYLGSDAQQLLENIRSHAQNGDIMFGVANGVSRAYNNLKAEGDTPGDCRQITGKDPQFIENDFLFKRDQVFWKNEMARTRAAYNKGCVIGYCWHLRDPISGDFRLNDQNKNVAKKILSPKESMEKSWFFSLIDTMLTPVFMELDFPVIFRPFHEMNGNWFWWGSKAIDPEQYVELYRATVDRIRKNGVKNVIFCWSPDTRLTDEYYPGDDYVDIIGLDVYEPGCSPYHPDSVYVAETRKLLDFARIHHKIPAITETGLREYNNVMRFPEEIPDFWSKMVFAPLLDQKGRGNGIAYVMSWYNANWSGNNRGSLYIPYKGIEQTYGENGKKAIQDLKQLSKQKHVIFCGDASYYKKK